MAHARDGVSWATDGGDMGVVIGTYPAQGALQQWRRITLDKAVVQDWVRNPANNHGFMIRNESSANDGVGFYSNKHSNKTLTPRMVITYTERATTVASVRAGLRNGAHLGVSDRSVEVTTGSHAVRVRVMNAAGALVCERVVAAKSRCRVDAGACPAGVYLIELRNADGSLIAARTHMLRRISPYDACVRRGAGGGLSAGPVRLHGHVKLSGLCLVCRCRMTSDNGPTQV